jgi:VWFA-related protein
LGGPGFRALVSVCATAGVAAIAAQQARPARPAPPPQQPTFRSTVNLVEVDVTAVDKDNNPVRGLTAADFTLLDRGKAQGIAAFEEVSHAHAPAPSPVAALPPTLKRDVASNQSAASDRLVVMVIDDLHLFKGLTDRVKTIAQQVVSDLGPQATMGVLFTSGDHNIEPTEDRSELLAAVATLTARQLTRRPVTGPEDPKLRSVNLQVFEDNQETIQTLADAARLLATGTPRRKAFVFISEGVGKDLTGMYESEITPCEARCAQCPCLHSVGLQQMMDAMQRSNVSVYAIDPRGQVTRDDLARECQPSPPGLCDPCMGDCPGQVPAMDNWIALAQTGLGITADASGGFAVTNTNDFASGLDRIISDLDHYYLLGFSPSPGKGYHRIDVTVDRPGVILHFRNGYEAGPPPAPKKNANPLMGLAAGPMPDDDLALRLGATPLLSHTAVALEVSEPRAPLTGLDGSVSDSLRYTVFAVDLKHGKVVRQFTNTARLVPERMTSVPDPVVFQLPVDLALPPGRYQLRASAESTALGKGGSVYLAVDVPDFTQQPLAVSDLMLGYAGGPHVVVGGAAGQSASSAAQSKAFVPTLDRMFTAADTLRVYFEVSARLPMQAVHARVEIDDPHGHPVKSLPAPPPPDGSGRFDVRVPLADLAPGAYVLRAGAAAIGPLEDREVGFIIR